MAGNFSPYIVNKVAGVTLCGSAFTAPACIYIALFTQLDTVTNANSVTEVTTPTAYLRKFISFGAPSSGQVSNSNQVTFPTATTPWGTIGYMGLYDSISGGNLLYWAIANPLNVATGNIYQVPVSNLTITEGASY